MSAVGFGDPHKLVSLVPFSALDGSQCEDACEVCPLRPWKSLSSVYCRDVLEEHRAKLDAQRASQSLHLFQVASGQLAAPTHRPPAHE